MLIADRFQFTVTDLGAGPELTRVAVGGVLILLTSVSY